MVYVTLAPAIMLPAVWVRGPDDMDFDKMISELDALGAEAIVDAGGWAALALKAEWVEPGRKPVGMEMDIGAVMRRLIENAVATSDGDFILASKRLGVAPSTLYRWRKAKAKPSHLLEHLRKSAS